MMQNLLKEWKNFLKEVEENTNQRFDNNVEIIRSIYKNSSWMGGSTTLSLIDSFTPENAKILTQIDLEDPEQVMGGAYGKVFPIKNSDMLLKLFIHGEKVENDIKRMKKVADQIFKGEASLGQMHYFEFGTLGDAPENINEAGTERQTQPEPGYQKPVPKQYFKYVVMPQIITFTDSVFFGTGAKNDIRMNRRVFNMLSEAIQKTARNAHNDITYTDFFNDVIERISKGLRESLFYTPKEERKAEVDKLSERFDDLQDIFSKIIRIAYKTFKKEGGTDLHIGNLGFFPQKPDDWFYFDM